ncbi:MAG: sigma-70 family RNA polymerase sigma factor [Actinomycetota bacterium]|nr:sigma-70 family RNA polymerase sigma factor [Actinomycetota bacterium]
MATDRDDRAFEQVYKRYSLAVLAYCVRRAGQEVAADASSETFLVVWRRLDQLPPEPKTLPYLYGVAARVLANQRRSIYRRSRLDSRLANLGIAAVPDPAVIVASRAQDAEVLAAVRRLGPKDREIVMLYTWEELPRETIAEMMGMTKTAVDQRIHRSYQRLARSLSHAITSNAIQSPLVAEEGGGR